MIVRRRKSSVSIIAGGITDQQFFLMKNKKRGSNEKVEKTTQNLLTEQNPYNIITKCDVVRDA